MAGAGNFNGGLITKPQDMGTRAAGGCPYCGGSGAVQLKSSGVNAACSCPAGQSASRSASSKENE